MAKKERQVGTIKHVSGVDVPLMFNPNERGTDALTFSATIADQSWRGKSADEVQRAVRSYLDKNSKLDWVPVIQVTESSPFGGNNEMSYVGLEIERHYLAFSVNAPNSHHTVRQLSWEAYAENYEHFSGGHSENVDMRRIALSKWCNVFEDVVVATHGARDIRACLPYTNSSRGDKRYILAYSAETWASLEAIQAGIGRLKLELRKLLSTDAGHAQLLKVGRDLLNMLPAPADAAVPLRKEWEDDATA